MTTTLLIIFLLGTLVAGAQSTPTKAQMNVAPTAVKTKPVVDTTTGMELIFVKGGCYQMGDTFGDGERSEKPPHEVCVSDFNLGKYKVTQRQWEKIMGNNPSGNKECGPNCPVENVSWNVVQEFIKKLNTKSGKQFRLPTEAEWEYAARSGGKKEKWAGISDETALAEYAWYDKDGASSPRPVGLKKANGLGLYDMSGNVWEWCQDWYNEGYYAASPKNNPPGPDTGSTRVLRGRIYNYDSRLTTVTFRASDDPAVDDSNNGFRLVLSAH